MLWQQSNDAVSAKQHNNNKRNGMERRCQRAVKDYYYYFFLYVGLCWKNHRQYINRQSNNKQHKNGWNSGMCLLETDGAISSDPNLLKFLRVILFKTVNFICSINSQAASVLMMFQINESNSDWKWNFNLNELSRFGAKLNIKLICFSVLRFQYFLSFFSALVRACNGWVLWEIWTFEWDGFSLQVLLMELQNIHGLIH